MPKNIVLFLNENPLPQTFTRGTISGKELRLRAALEEIDEVHAIALPGKPVQLQDDTQTNLEKKVTVHLTLPWPYYASSIILFVYGLYYTLKLKPKVIEAESPLFSGPAAVLLGKLFHIPSTIEYRASYEHLIDLKLTWIPRSVKKLMLEAIQRFTLRLATIRIVNSKTYQRYVKKLGFNSVEINPGLQYLPPNSTPTRRRNVIGFLGRLVPEKGVNMLLEAVHLIRDELVEKGIKVEIAGEGAARKQLEQQTYRLGIDSLISFIGFQKNYEILRQWKFLINPCIVWHPLEMVNAEAAAMGTPVICFGNSQIPETVIHQTSGLKVKSVTKRALAACIKKLISDRTLQQKLRLHGKKLILTQYDFTHQVERLKKVYQDNQII